MTGFFLGSEDFTTSAEDEVDAGGVEQLVGDGGGNGGIGLVGVESGHPG